MLSNASAGDFNDLYVYHPVSRTWNAPGIVSGPSPSPREGLGLANLADQLYLFGGGSFDLSGGSFTPSPSLRSVHIMHQID